MAPKENSSFPSGKAQECQSEMTEVPLETEASASKENMRKPETPGNVILQEKDFGLTNILKNSFLKKPVSEWHRKQIMNSVQRVLLLNSYHQKVKIDADNVFLMINMQMKVSQGEFLKIPLKHRLRIVSLLFVKYVNRAAFARVCKKFMDDLDFETESGMLKSLKKYDSPAQLTPRNPRVSIDSPKSVLGDYFSIDNNETLCTFKTERFFKKLLIYVITLMKVMNEYLSLKISKKKITFKLSPVAYMIELSNQFNADAMRNKITVDGGLLSNSLEELLNMVNIEDFRTYIMLNHVYIYKNNQKVEVHVEHRGKQVKVTMTKKEQRDVLCCRTKRKDELVKMSFKFIKRKILKEFEKIQKKKNRNIKKNNWKKKFYKEYFEGNEVGIKYFEFFDLSKKRLETLKRFSKLTQKLKEFHEKQFIKEMVKEYIVDQSKYISDPHLGLDKFVGSLMSRQQKHSMVLQNVLNALKEFGSFFNI
jgi:hypothetical protein